MVKFDINTETGESGVKELRQTVEDLNALVVSCDQTVSTLETLDKTMGLNKPAIGLIQSAKEALQAVIPALDESLVPIEEFVKNMAAAQEAIEGSTAGNLDVG